MKDNLKKLAIVLFFIMFLYSGVMKIFRFDKKVKVLKTKTGLPLIINQLGMIGVILLEIIGSIIIILHYIKPNLIKSKMIVNLTKILFLLFLIVVTALYHPPSRKMMIPFLSNLTTFGGLLYIYAEN